jgi:DNA-binding CsgD family transcriptional regulator
MTADEVVQPRAELSEAEKELATRVATGLTDDEIATQLEISKHHVVERIARLLAKIGGQDRLEILLYAYSNPTIYKRINGRTQGGSETGPRTAA